MQKLCKFENQAFLFVFLYVSNSYVRIAWKPSMMNSQKVKFSAFPSFRRKPESSNINMFWMPPYQVRGRLIKSGMTVGGLFASPSSMKIRKNFALNMLPFFPYTHSELSSQFHKYDRV
jgi:hypothetical protein